MFHPPYFLNVSSSMITHMVAHPAFLFHCNKQNQVWCLELVSHKTRLYINTYFRGQFGSSYELEL
jgi:hypothetical protein